MVTRKREQLRLTPRFLTLVADCRGVTPHSPGLGRRAAGWVWGVRVDSGVDVLNLGCRWPPQERMSN